MVTARPMTALDNPLELATRVAGAVVDPEIPTLTLEDLGVLRGVTIEDGRVVVTITPTYSGCPAMSTIRTDLTDALHAAGYEDVAIVTVLSPPWTTEWMTEQGRRELEMAAIAPPNRPVVCPRCRAPEVTELSRFGTTACKALMVCDRCGEPFDLFKDL